MPSKLQIRESSEQVNQKTKQLLDIRSAPVSFPAKDLPLYYDISYILALKLAKTEPFGFRFGEKRLFIHRDRFIQWMESRTTKTA
jgi:hypothetical protein